VTTLLALIRDFILGGFLFLLPGWALLRLYPEAGRLSWKIKAGLAPGLSLSVYPLLFLLARLLHLPTTGILMAAPGFLALAALAWVNRNEKNLGLGKIRLERDSLFFFLLLVSIFIVRMLVVRGLPAPAWGDSVHHTTIVRLLVENHGLFSSWAPYAPMITFSYHFGFHAAAAAWALVAGVPAIEAVLSAGQILNVLAVIVLYPVAVRLGKSRWAGIAAVAFAGLHSVLPGFSVNWGRYTQLAGQVVLPVLIWFLLAHWRDEAPPRPGTIALLALLFAGVFLAHYRVAVVTAAAAAAWSLRALWDRRKKISDWGARVWRLGLAVIGAIVLVSPWLGAIVSGRTPQIIGRSIRSGTAPAVSDLALWSHLGFYAGATIGIIGAAALLIALLRNRNLAADMILWCGLVFLAANPQLIGLPGGGIESNFILVAGLYVPVAWLFGAAVGEAADKIDRKSWGRVAVAAVFVAALFFGVRQQMRIVDPFFALVEPNDVTAFRWIRLNTPKSARFMTNAYLAFEDKFAVGTDAGWWLPYFTRRPTPFPPLQFSTERLPPDMDRAAPRRLVAAVRTTGGDPGKLAELFKSEGLAYVFLGEKRGSAGYDAAELIPENWLRAHPDFVLVARFGNAQVWRFLLTPPTRS
jgi:hypothetical protein